MPEPPPEEAPWRECCCPSEADRDPFCPAHPPEPEPERETPVYVQDDIPF